MNWSYSQTVPSFHIISYGKNQKKAPQALLEVDFGGISFYGMKETLVELHSIGDNVGMAGRRISVYG